MCSPPHSLFIIWNNYWQMQSDALIEAIGACLWLGFISKEEEERNKLHNCERKRTVAEAIWCKADCAYVHLVSCGMEGVGIAEVCLYIARFGCSPKQMALYNAHSSPCQLFCSFILVFDVCFCYFHTGTLSLLSCNILWSKILIMLLMAFHQGW